AARSCVAGLAAPGGSRSAWIALSRRSLWPKGMPSFSRSAAERSPSTSASMWLARKAASYCERSRLLSHAPMSTAAPLRAVLAVAAARILGIVSQQLRREVSQKHDQDRMGDFRRDALIELVASRQKLVLEDVKRCQLLRRQLVDGRILANHLRRYVEHIGVTFRLLRRCRFGRHMTNPLERTDVSIEASRMRQGDGPTAPFRAPGVNKRPTDPIHSPGSVMPCPINRADPAVMIAEILARSFIQAKPDSSRRHLEFPGCPGAGTDCGLMLSAQVLYGRHGAAVWDDVAVCAGSSLVANPQLAVVDQRQ